MQMMIRARRDTGAIRAGRGTPPGRGPDASKITGIMLRVQGLHGERVVDDQSSSIVASSPSGDYHE